MIALQLRRGDFLTKHETVVHQVVASKLNIRVVGERHDGMLMTLDFAPDEKVNVHRVSDLIEAWSIVEGQTIFIGDSCGVTVHRIARNKQGSVLQINDRYSISANQLVRVK